MVRRSTEQICSRKVYFSSRSVLEEGMSLVDDRIIIFDGIEFNVMPYVDAMDNSVS